MGLFLASVKTMCEMLLKRLPSWSVLLFINWRCLCKEAVWLVGNDWKCDEECGVLPPCLMDPSMTTPAGSKRMSHRSFSLSIVKQELIQCSQQMLTPPQRGNLSLLLLPLMKGLLNITLFWLKLKVNTGCTESCLHILQTCCLFLLTMPPPHLPVSFA